MLRSRSALAVCFAAASVSVLVGCGSTKTETPPPGEENTGPGLLPPEPGPENAGDGPGVVLAINKLYFGETNRDGTPNKANGWKQYGYDLDGTISTVESKNLCKPAAGAAPSAVYPDGDNGIDNSFGKNILPIILGIEPAPSTRISEGIADGDFTIMLKIEGLGTGTEYNPLLAKLYGGAALATPPLWDGTDAWPVLPELLSDPTDIESAKVQFATSYVVENTWVSGSKGNINLGLSVAGYTLGLTISSALLSLEFAGDHKSATRGTIAGVLETEVLITELQKVIGAFQPSLCEGSTIEGILNQIRQASDIMKDGSQNPDAECNGISIGLGFDMKEVRLGDIAPPAVPGENPCAMPAGGGI